MILKFTSYKEKYSNLLSRLSLNTNHVTVSKDFSVATRHARNEIYGVREKINATFNLSHNKLLINFKCHAFDSGNNSVYEIGPVTSPVLDVIYTSPSAT